MYKRNICANTNSDDVDHPVPAAHTAEPPTPSAEQYRAELSPDSLAVNIEARVASRRSVRLRRNRRHWLRLMM
jgi:hypothetical protein